MENVNMQKVTMIQKNKFYGGKTEAFHETWNMNTFALFYASS